MTQTRAIALISGGLDSILAARIIADQGLKVIGLHFLTPFSAFTLANIEHSPAAQTAAEAEIDFLPVALGEEYLEIVKNPKFGFGRAANPCIDCHAFFIKQAAKLLKQLEAQFIVTGEVLGQRPMSQHGQALNQIDKESGMKGLVLRPLSAKLLAETIPEQRGWVAREKLLALSGRSRKEQFRLAEQFGLKSFSTPAGGCLLTMQDFAQKVKDLLQYQPDFNLEDVKLIRLGRNFRLSPSAKLVVGKNDAENKKIISLALPGDILILTDNVPGPAGLVRGKATNDDLAKACAIVAHYVHKCPLPEVPLTLQKIGDKEFKKKFSAPRMAREQLEAMRIK